MTFLLRLPLLRWLVASLVVIALGGWADCRKVFDLDDAERQLGDIDIAHSPVAPHHRHAGRADLARLRYAEDSRRHQ